MTATTTRKKRTAAEARATREREFSAEVVEYLEMLDRRAVAARGYDPLMNWLRAPIDAAA